MPLPPIHPQRVALHNEIHARPPEAMGAPLALSHIVMVADAGQRGQPVLRHRLQRGGGLVLAQPLRGDGAREGPGHEFGVQLPADAEAAQVHAQVDAVGIRLRQVMVAQQRRQVCAAGLALLRVRHHHDVRQRQRRAHRLRRPGVDLVVQRRALRMVLRMGHAAILPDRHDKQKRRPQAPLS